MRAKTLDDLVIYIYKRYTYPKSWWANAHIEKRCTEIYTSEQVILKCMESPTIEPKEIIFDYIVTIESLVRDVTNIKVKKMFNTMICTLNTLYDYFLNGGNT